MIIICHSLGIYITNLSFECLILLAHTIPEKSTISKSKNRFNEGKKKLTVIIISS